MQAIIEQLNKIGLLNEQTLLMRKEDEHSVILDAGGNQIETNFFHRIKAPFALFSSGKYSLLFAKKGRKLIAATDDTAMIFGHRVKWLRAGFPRGNALLLDKGFVVIGRYPQELIAAAILIEKMCRAEVLAPKIGRIHYLSPMLSMIERFVYRKSYSKKEKNHYENGK